MKAYLFIDKGETRLPKEGEAYLCHGEILFASKDFKCEKLPILVNHEFEIPKKATAMIPLWQFNDGERVGNDVYIKIPHPKKKVKKWNFLMRRHNGTGAFYISYPEVGTHEAYISRASVDDVVVSAIPQTEIEVEE